MQCAKKCKYVRTLKLLMHYACSFPFPFISIEIGDSGTKVIS